MHKKKRLTFYTEKSRKIIIISSQCKTTNFIKYYLHSEHNKSSEVLNKITNLNVSLVDCFLLLIDCGLEGNLNKEMHTFSKNKKKNTIIIYLKRKKCGPFFWLQKWNVISFGPSFILSVTKGIKQTDEQPDEQLDDTLVHLLVFINTGY